MRKSKRRLNARLSQLTAAEEGASPAARQRLRHEELLCNTMDDKINISVASGQASSRKLLEEGASPVSASKKPALRPSLSNLEMDNDSAQIQKLTDAWNRFEDARSARYIFSEVDLATLMAPENAIGRQVRVYWPQEDAWFKGEVTSYDAATGRHQVSYIDDDQESLWLAQPVERVRLALNLGEILTPPTPAGLLHLSRLLGQQADILLGARTPAARAKECSSQAELLWECSKRLQAVAEGVPDSSPATKALLPGEVVWAKAKGWPYWPAVIRTPEDAEAHSLKGARSGICVQFFGEATWSCLKPPEVLSFMEGVHQGLYKKQKRVSMQKAIGEAITYLQEGELPEAMQLKNNDSGFSSDDEEAVACQPAYVCSTTDTEAGWRVSRKLIVHSLGQIEFLHPGFHTEKHIWPLGYHSTSLFAASPAQDPAQHECRILAAPDGSGPLFQVACNGALGESKVSPQRAWQKLEGQLGRRVGAAGSQGEQVFGLLSKRVMAKIQQLPDIQRLEKYSCWPAGQRPQIPLLTVSERRARLKAMVEMQQLPEGIKEAEVQPMEGPCCEACGAEEESEDNILLQCDGPCRAFVHQECCGVLDRPTGSWVCDFCATGCAREPACILCPARGSLLLRTRCGRWAHAACALWIPEAFIETQPDSAALVDASRIPKARRQLACSLCKQSYGACIQCGGSQQCFTAFHLLCARRSGLVTECIHDEQFEAEPQAKQPEARLAISLVASSSQEGPIAAPKRRRTAGRGTAVGDGTRLVCYCRKHQPVIPSKQLPAAGTASCQQGGGVPSPAEAVGQCARFQPYDHAQRRGQRAPEAAAAAIAKRAFLRAEPYQVTELPTRPGSRPLPSRCCTGDEQAAQFWGSSSTDAGSRAAAKAVGRSRVRDATTAVISVTERYKRMRATEAARVAFGKSMIHGWGALSKVRHAKGEMIIEYSGELVRPSVADVRERQLYDRLVGAGTYVFRMSDELCVDATRAGNLAHMLNHSCQPNCFSRTIQIANDKNGRLEEHVVIVANADIEAGQELTYNYRFSSAEVLHCNCGAPNCCGLVNDSGVAQQGYLMIPKGQLMSFCRME